MTTTESSIVAKITAEIETAAGDERSKLITDLWTVVAIAEKRVALEAKGILPTLEAEAKTALAGVGTAARNIVNEIKERV